MHPAASSTIQHHPRTPQDPSPWLPNTALHFLSAFLAPAILCCLWHFQIPCPNLVQMLLLPRTGWLKPTLASNITSFQFRASI